MSKWNQKGMGPQNLSLIEDLLLYLIERHFVPAHIMHGSPPQLDLTRSVVLRAGGF